MSTSVATSKKTIKVSEKVYRRINALRVYPREPINEILQRILEKPRRRRKVVRQIVDPDATVP